MIPTTTDKLSRYLSPANRARRVVAMQAATIERCEAITARVIGPGRITDLLLADRPLTPAEWAEIDAAERMAGYTA